MADFPYVQTSSKAAGIFEAIRARGNPPRVTTRWLGGAGFKSTSDRAFVKTLKFLGILSKTGEPTEKYAQIKEIGWQENLAEIIRTAYGEIFTDYPNAHSLQKPQLIDLFRVADPDASQRTLDLKVTTFLNLCKAADFSETNLNSPETNPVKSDSHLDQSASVQGEEEISSLTVNINISLEIPTVSDPAVYDALFSSMAQHLRGMMKGESN